MIQNLHRVIQLIEGDWRKTRVLVIGDIMLDRYIWGDVERISPEAPVPIIRVSHSSAQPGCAGNVAMNIAGLGAVATLFGFCGEDSERKILDGCLRAAGIKTMIVPVVTRPTTVKLRILGGKQQMLRLDTEMTDDYPVEAQQVLLENVKRELPSADAVILSDYAKGVLTEVICQEIIQSSCRLGIPVLVDPKQRTFSRYHGATTICPNLSELSSATGISSSRLDALLAQGQKLVSTLELDCLTVTMSEKGIVVLRQDSKFLAPAMARQVFDVSGAGDTVIATLALGAASGIEMETAVQLANIAAGIVVSKVGTVPINRDELLTSLAPEIELYAEEKILSVDRLRMRVTAWRSAGQSIVFTNGCFDLLHLGHITLLESARREGDRLIVAINSDTSVQELKGPSRPIVNEHDRARTLAALSAVDAIIIFDESTPLSLIETFRPEVIVKGGDYNENSVVGAREVRSWGGRVRIIPTVPGFSTTKMIAGVMKANVK